jgi:hypothetical protein
MTGPNTPSKASTWLLYFLFLAAYTSFTKISRYLSTEFFLAIEPR